MSKPSSSPDYARNSQVINKYGTVKMKSKVLKIWTSRYLILCRDSQFGPACFARYSSKKAFEGNKIENIYPLESINVIRGKIDNRCGVVLVLYDNSRLEFKCKTAVEADSWIYSTGSLLDSVRRNSGSTFMVTAFPCNVTEGKRIETKLIVDRDGVSMTSLNDNQRYFRWPYEVIKTYQNDDTSTVSIEVGRSAETGTGVYRFSSDQAVIIVNKIQHMLRTRGKDSTDSNPLYQKTYRTDNPIFEKDIDMEPSNDNTSYVSDSIDANEVYAKVKGTHETGEEEVTLDLYDELDNRVSPVYSSVFLNAALRQHEKEKLAKPGQPNRTVHLNMTRDVNLADLESTEI